MEENQEAATETEPQDSAPVDDATVELASRWSRLVAAIIDGLIILVVLMPVILITGGFAGMTDARPGFFYTLFMALVGVGVFVLLNGKLLQREGMTIGKRIMGIKIVTLDNQLPDVKEHLVKRYAVYFLLGQIPFVGPLLSLINILLIFGKGSRCGHDMVADTRVIVA